jgi:glycosyltransferase involved in cell wall biosynthesis
MVTCPNGEQSSREPPVTVVVPAYNHASTLPAAVDSLLAQDYPALEIIVLDDGSTDDTRSVLARYGAGIRWETHANMGQAATLNKGWGMSNGEFLGYLSADDFLYPGAVRYSVAELVSNPGAAAVYCDFDLVDPAGNRMRKVSRPEFRLEHVLTTLDCPPGPGAFFRRSAYASAGGWNPELRQIPDFDFWLRLARQGKFVHVSESLAAWRVHPGSQSFAAVNETRAGESVHVISNFFSDRDLDPRLSALKTRSMARAYLYSAQLHGRAGRYRAAVAGMIEAHRLYPATAIQPETWRSIANALFSRPAHKLLWGIRKIGGAKA